MTVKVMEINLSKSVETLYIDLICLSLIGVLQGPTHSTIGIRLNHSLTTSL